MRQRRAVPGVTRRPTPAITDPVVRRAVPRGRRCRCGPSACARCRRFRVGSSVAQFRSSVPSGHLRLAAVLHADGAAGSLHDARSTAPPCCIQSTATCAVTLHACLRAADLLQRDGIRARVIGCYSVKPIDGEALRSAVSDTGGRIVVAEDHHPEGGLGSAVAPALLAGGPATLSLAHLAVHGMPGSGRRRTTARLGPCRRRPRRPPPRRGRPRLPDAWANSGPSFIRGRAGPGDGRSTRQRSSRRTSPRPRAGPTR